SCAPIRLLCSRSRISDSTADLDTGMMEKGGSDGLSISAVESGGPQCPLVEDGLLSVAALLLADGHTTERTRIAIEGLSARFGITAKTFVGWDGVTILIHKGGLTFPITAAAEPTGVDMGKVAATSKIVDDACDGAIDAPALLSSLDDIRHRSSVSMARFVL